VTCLTVHLQLCNICDSSAEPKYQKRKIPADELKYRKSPANKPPSFIHPYTPTPLHPNSLTSYTLTSDPCPYSYSLNPEPGSFKRNTLYPTPYTL
jgi:hypothetical protein